MKKVTIKVHHKTNQKIINVNKLKLEMALKKLHKKGKFDHSLNNINSILFLAEVSPKKIGYYYSI